MPCLSEAFGLQSHLPDAFGTALVFLTYDETDQ